MHPGTVDDPEPEVPTPWGPLPLPTVTRLGSPRPGPQRGSAGRGHRAQARLLGPPPRPQPPVLPPEGLGHLGCWFWFGRDGFASLAAVTPLSGPLNSQVRRCRSHRTPRAPGDPSSLTPRPAVGQSQVASGLESCMARAKPALVNVTKGGRSPGSLRITHITHGTLALLSVLTWAPGGQSFGGRSKPSGRWDRTQRGRPWVVRGCSLISRRRTGKWPLGQATWGPRWP